MALVALNLSRDQQLEQEVQDAPGGHAHKVGRDTHTDTRHTPSDVLIALSLA